MKRLLSFTVAFALLFTAGIAVLDAQTVFASAQAVDAKAIAGMAAADLEANFGPADRTEPSEYGFTWHVYSRDYSNYFMAGVRDGQVVAVYTTAATLRYGGDFALGASKSAVRAALGNPVSYIQCGNTIAVLSDTDQKDMIPVGDKYVIVFYDLIDGGGVTSVLIVPQADQARTMTERQPLTQELTEAYQRTSVDLINAARARRGLRALAVDTLDANLAIQRSMDMVTRDYFSHYNPENKTCIDLAREMGFRFTSLGENIAYGNNNAMLAHESFMNSSGHRNNVLKSAYTKVGAGVAAGGSRYVLLTNIFSNNTAEPPAASEPSTPSVSDPARYDVNRDGAVTISDYTLVRLTILGLRALEGDASAADVNGDGNVSISDYTLIRLALLGLK